MATKKILSIGGSGQLGSFVTKALLPHHITNIDFSSSPNSLNNILLRPQLAASQNNKSAIKELKQKYSNCKYDSIIVTAGGWVGGSIKDQDYLQKSQRMIDVNMTPCLLAAYLSQHYLAEKGLVIFTGSAAVFKEPQPQMIAYSISKTGVHSLALNLTQTFIKNEKQQRIVTILPDTIDTETNRKAMPNSDFSKWAKPNQIAQLIRGWVDGLNVPNNGSYALLKVKNQCISVDFV